MAIFSGNVKPPAPPTAATRRETGLRPVGGAIKVQVGAKAVGSFLPMLTQKAFERYGFPAAALLTDWEAIAGKQLASYTRPERLKWPRHASEETALEADGGIAANVPAGATMVLRVEGPRALEIQHRRDQLLERINAYFGFRAVTELRFVQAPVTAKPLQKLPRPAAAVAPRQALDLKGIGDPRLRSSLERLGRAVEARRVGETRSLEPGATGPRTRL